MQHNSYATLAFTIKAKQVEDLEAVLTTGTTEMLLGKPAPEIALPKLGGGSMKLNEAKDEKSVVLIFWASWNAVSVQALPPLAKLQAEFKDVAFLAVNAGEEAPAVATCLKKQPFGLDVLLDPDDKAIERFGVTNLPTLIVIDKKGLVHSVHETSGHDLIKGVRTNLEALAAAPAK